MEINEFPNLGKLGLPKVGQLGFIVNDIERSRSRYSDLFNIQNWFEPKYAEKKFHINHQTIHLDQQLLLAFTGPLQIELISAESKQENLYQDHLTKYGEGLHHLGFYTSNFDDQHKEFQRLGISPLLEGNFITAGGGKARFAYFDTRRFCGITLEISEVKLFGIQFPQTEFLFNIATLTGDVIKIKA